MAALNEVICGKHRQGKLCGRCSNNMLVYYHSNSYHCHPNSKKCKFGFLLYVVSETISVTILFTVVLFFNVKFTSGALNGFIFFIQFIDTMLIDANGFISTHDVLDTLTSIYLFTYRMFNLNFFTYDGLSFCLWEGANTLDIFAFKQLCDCGLFHYPSTSDRPSEEIWKTKSHIMLQEPKPLQIIQ